MDLRDEFSELRNQPIENVQQVSGGDINDAYLVQYSDDHFFIKVNRQANGNEILQAEYEALKYLYNLNWQFAPKPKGLRTTKSGTPCLLMEAIAEGESNIETQRNLASVVHQLHQHKGSSFGWKSHNFIGRLHQYNDCPEGIDWPNFYWHYRIRPQLQLAIAEKHYGPEILKMEGPLIKILESWYPKDQEPRLTHGDLWAGNYLIDQSGRARLIDPALAFAHPEMDIAMSQLFGGFGKAFYRQYYKLSGLDGADLNERIPMYQLYYLLVHLNMFGASYKASCNRIFRQYQLI